ncbi:MAG: hypothetical protein Ta2E_13030 [Mycoplasmoidaceae bacterium]|nr:MAG: hypothetical protein Ta2E_13030 [Mycoplasmoidaceae bacterium]
MKDYLLNRLKNLKSNISILTIVVWNSNNFIGYSVLSVKSEAVLKSYLNDDSIQKRYTYIDLRDLSLHFDEGSVISWTINDPENPDDT